MNVISLQTRTGQSFGLYPRSRRHWVTHRIYPIWFSCCWPLTPRWSSGWRSCCTLSWRTTPGCPRSTWPGAFSSSWCTWATTFCPLEGKSILLYVRKTRWQFVAFCSFFACFWAYVGQPHGHMGWAKSMPFASINPTNPRTNPWNFHEKILRIDEALKMTFV